MKIDNPSQFRAYLKEHSNAFRLPDPIFNEAMREQQIWNQLCDERQRRSDAWLAAHPNWTTEREAWNQLRADRKAAGVKIKKWEKKHPKPKFGDTEYWKQWEEYLNSVAATGNGMERERNADIVNRFKSVFKRLKHGGGFPKPKRGITHFSILLVRYTGGGATYRALIGNSKRFRMVPPDASAYFTNSRDNRRSRQGTAWFSLGTSEIGLDVIFHSEVPVDSIYKRVYFCGRRESFVDPWEYYLSFTAERNPATEQKEPPVYNKTKVVDLNWRLIDDRIRFAVVYNGHRIKEYFFPRAFVRNNSIVSPEAISNLRALRSEIVQSCKKSMQGWLAERGIQGGAFDKLGARGLRQLLFELESNGEHVDIKTGLQTWNRQYIQYLVKERMLRNWWNRRRDWVYGNVAKEIVTDSNVVLRMIDLPKLKEKDSNKGAERRDWIALGKLKIAISNAAHKRDGKIIENNEEVRCFVCGGQIVDLTGSDSQVGCAKGHLSDGDHNIVRWIFSQTRGNNVQSEGLRKKSMAAHA